MNENIFIALVKDIISVTTQPLLFAIAFSYMTMKHIGVRPHKEKINISKEFINKTR